MERPSTVVDDRDNYPANGEAPVDRERLRYVTRAVSAPSLVMVWLGTLLFLGELRGMWGGPKGWLVALAQLAVGVAFIVAVRQDWIARYYQKRFGSVEAQEPSAKQFGVLLLALIVLALFSLFFGRWAERSLDSIALAFSARVHSMLSDPTHQIRLSASFVWTMYFLASLRRRPGRIERQNQCFALSGLVGFASIASLAAWHPGVRHLELWRILNAGGLSLSFIAWGLYEHMRLTRLLPRRVSESDDE